MLPLRKGMIIKFKKPVWERKRGRFYKVDEIEIKGEIINDSYGEKKGQHTFTILDENGNRHFIKGRHLYQTAEIIDYSNARFYTTDNLSDLYK